jgi:predicted nuclease of predicted toxin-antitoxin system
MGQRPRIRFFIDNCVPDSVGRALAAAGHEVTLLRQALAPDAPDPLVAKHSEALGAVLVTCDKDFRVAARRVDVGSSRFKKLSLIGLRCPEPEAAARISAALTLIEHEWDAGAGAAGRRLFVEIGADFIRTNR